MKRISLFSLFIILLICVQSLDAKISVTVNGKTSGASFAQGDIMSWIISGIPFGATVTNHIWIDLDSNDVASSSTDIMMYTFSQTDGPTIGDMRDKDSTVNGIIQGGGKQTGLMPSHYLLKSIYGTDTASVTFTIYKMSSPTYTISGTVKQSATAVANIVINAYGRDTGDWLALTDANGNYIMDTKAKTGEQDSVTLLSATIPSGYLVSPQKYDITMNANIIGIDFALDKSTGVDQTTSASPKEFALNQNYPNPFNPSTTILYGLPNRSNVRLVITNTLGQEVAVLTNGEQEAGYHEIEWHANVASGIYFYRIDAVSVNDPNNRFVQVKKMLLLK